MASYEVVLAWMVAALALSGPTRWIGVGRVAPWVRAARARVELGQSARAALVAALPPSQVIDVAETGVARQSLWGVVRVAMEGGRYAFGDGLAPSRLVDATPVPRGWVFRTEYGELFASERFLGPLRPLRVPGGRCLEPVIHPSHGRAVVRADAFFVTDGETFTRVDPPEPALAVAFGTSDRGVAIVEGGALAETRDGGRSWTRLSAPVARGLALRAVLGGVVVTDANGSEHLIQGGRDTPKVGPSRALREAEPAMRRALVDHRGVALLRAAVTPEAPCRPTRNALDSTAFATFTVDHPNPRADGSGAELLVTGRRVAVLAAARDAWSLRFPGAVGRVWSAGEGSLQLRWRLLGDLVTRSASIAPGSFAPERIDVLAAARAGLFVRGTGNSLTPVWTGAVDTHVTLPSPTLLAATGYTSTTTRAVPTEDGGFVLYAMPPELEQPNTAYARLHDEPRDLSRNRLIRCGPAGCDAFDWYGQRDRAVVRAIGRRGTDWGLVVQGAAGVSFVTAAGAARIDVDLGAEPTLCAPSRGTMELHVSARDEFGECPAEIGPGLDAPDFARCTRVVYELQGRGLCVRRVEGERGADPDGLYAEGGPEVPRGGVWFDARGASLVGGVDDGHTIGSLRAVLRAYTPNPMEALE